MLESSFCRSGESRGVREEQHFDQSGVSGASVDVRHSFAVSVEKSADIGVKFAEFVRRDKENGLGTSAARCQSFE